MKTSSAARKSSKVRTVRGPVAVGAQVRMWRDRVIPARKVPLGMGVKSSPSLTMKTLAVAVSATLPSASATSALP
jgi:hypothetical protein